jgi:hypothetical protein
VGLVIGILLTLISVLVAGIFFVVFRGQRGPGKETPAHHSLIATKIQDRLAASIDFKVLGACVHALFLSYVDPGCYSETGVVILSVYGADTIPIYLSLSARSLDL